jgi:hypothetical protein
MYALVFTQYVGDKSYNHTNLQSSIKLLAVSLRVKFSFSFFFSSRYL